MVDRSDAGERRDLSEQMHTSVHTSDLVYGAETTAQCSGA
jgi:hypothetical protein